MDPADPGARPEDLAAALGAMTPEAQAALRRSAAHFDMLTDAEQRAALVAAHAEQVAHQADQVVEAALDAIRRGRPAAIVPRLAEAAADYERNRDSSAPDGDLAQFIRAVAAALLGKRPLPVVPTFASRLEVVVAALSAAGSPRA